MYGFKYKGIFKCIMVHGHSLYTYPMAHYDYAYKRAMELLEKYTYEEICDLLEHNDKERKLIKIEKSHEVEYYECDDFPNKKNQHIIDEIKDLYTWRDDRYNPCIFEDVFLGKNHKFYCQSDEYKCMSIEEFTYENWLNEEFICNLYRTRREFYPSSACINMTIIDLDNYTFEFHCSPDYFEFISNDELKNKYDKLTFELHKIKPLQFKHN